MSKNNYLDHQKGKEKVFGSRIAHNQVKDKKFMNPKISVCITTYNHEKFISQAIDSVLMQKTDFKFEVLIGEDDSTDNTRKIVKDYARSYPNKIRLFLNDRKNVIYIHGKPTGRWNFTNNIKHAKGNFIALLDGDDYWTDPNKLHMQVDFLERNADFAICFHNANVTYMNGNIESHPFYTQNPTGSYMHKKPESISTIEDLVGGNFLQTPSVVFRAHLFDSFPEWYYTLDRGDWPLHILNAQHGKIMYIDKIMANYQVHNDGIYSNRTRADQLEGAANVAITLDKYLSYKYHNIFFKKNTQRFLSMIQLHFTNGNYLKSFKCFFKYIETYRFECITAASKFILNRIILLINKI